MKHIFRKYFTIGLILLLGGCASKKKENLPELYSHEDYKKIIENTEICNDASTKCFYINYYRAKSFYRLGDLPNTLININKALSNYPGSIAGTDLIEAYHLQAQSLFRSTKQLDEFEKKRNLVDLLIEKLTITLSREWAINEFNNFDHYFGMQIILIESLLMKMDLAQVDHLKEIYKQIRKRCDYINQLKPESNPGDIYFSYAQAKLVIPKIKQWLFTGIGNRENLLIITKKLYKDSLQLRRHPEYGIHDDRRIEKHISEIDRYMKQLVF